VYDCEIKWAAPSVAQIKLDPESGIFEGFCAAYGNVDTWGDRLNPGSGLEVASRNPTLPIYFDHDWMQGQPPVGKSTGFDEREEGLWTSGQIFTTFDKGRQIHKGMIEGVLNSLSIGWKAKEWKINDGIREVDRYDLEEYSIVNFPANERARVTMVKAQLETVRLQGALGSKGLQESIEELLARLPKIDLTDQNVGRKEAPRTDGSDPIAVLLDEVDFLSQITTELKAEGREAEVRNAIVALKTAVVNLESALPMVEEAIDLSDVYRSLAANIREAVQAL
jgi:HK97 family phage prohead protease